VRLMNAQSLTSVNGAVHILLHKGRSVLQGCRTGVYSRAV
jgi:hypothetical protein